MGVRKVAKVKVRCLGPGDEHYFMSRDKARVRICEKCKKALAGVSSDKFFHVTFRPGDVPNDG